MQGLDVGGSWKLIAIPKLGHPYKADLPEGNRHPVVRSSSDRVEIDVGYYKGRRVRATFAKGKLQVNRALEKKVAPLTSDDCRWVFDHLKLCAEADRRPSCNGAFDEISQEWAMTSLRSRKMMEHNPRFSKSFANFCEDACGGTPKSDAEVGRAYAGLAGRRQIALQKNGLSQGSLIHLGSRVSR